MSVQVTVYGAGGCWKCTNTVRALELAGVLHQVVDVDAAGMRDELRARGIRELPYVVVEGGESWTGLRLDKIVELRREAGASVARKEVRDPDAMRFKSAAAVSLVARRPRTHVVRHH